MHVLFKQHEMIFMTYCRSGRLKKMNPQIWAISVAQAFPGPAWHWAVVGASVSAKAGWIWTNWVGAWPKMGQRLRKQSPSLKPSLGKAIFCLVKTDIARG